MLACVLDNAFVTVCDGLPDISKARVEWRAFGIASNTRINTLQAFGLPGSSPSALKNDGRAIAMKAKEISDLRYVFSDTAFMDCNKCAAKKIEIVLIS
jgi:hypothetical protein